MCCNFDMYSLPCLRLGAYSSCTLSFFQHTCDECPRCVCKDLRITTRGPASAPTYLRNPGNLLLLSGINGGELAF